MESPQQHTNHPKKPLHKRRWFQVSCVIAILVGSLKLVDTAHYLSTKPKATTLRAFLLVTPIGNTEYVKKHGETITIVYGVIPPVWCMASEPPVYVFDSNGQLVDWTQDLERDRDILFRWDDRMAKMRPKF